MVNLRRRVMELKEKKSDDWYTTDGLLYMWDGIQNTRNGHSNLITAWECLTDDSGNYDWPITSNQTVESNHIHLTNGLQLSSGSVAGNVNTVEIVMRKASTPSGYQAITPWQNLYWTIDRDVCRFHQPNKKGIYITRLSNRIVSYSVRSDISTDIDSIDAKSPLVNGDFLKLVWSDNEYWNSTGASRMFCQKGVTSYPLVGDVYCVRLYSKYLTNTERLHNWEIDKARFNIPVTEGGTDWTDNTAYSNVSVVENEYCENATGFFKSYEDWNRTDYIPCRGASTIVFPPLTGAAADGKASNWFFSADHYACTHFELSPTASSTIEVPKSAAYFVISSYSYALTACLNAGIVPHK